MIATRLTRIVLILAALSTLFWLCRRYIAVSAPGGKAATHSAALLPQQQSATASDSQPGADDSKDSVPQAEPEALKSAPAGDAAVARQMRILNEILASNNDNDPRMDQDLLALSAVAKETIRRRYAELPAEKRNQRGTLVFLLGRNITEAMDLEFLKQVLAEKACLSLENCRMSQSYQTLDSADAEHVGGMDIALAYPQVVALQALDSFFSTPAGRSPGLAKLAHDIVDTARRSQVPVVARMARDIDTKH